ncbi:MAG TPA: hypothetical protein VGR07_22975 [Thermoanaerobaculia bacterium]|jgi:hypothetical protein|nr:hypothetical protein [Thermoanaerobaculia bacterium]
MADSPVPVTIRIQHVENELVWSYDVDPERVHPHGPVFPCETYLLMLPKRAGTTVPLAMTLVPEDPNDTAVFDFQAGHPTGPVSPDNAITWMNGGEPTHTPPAGFQVDYGADKSQIVLSVTNDNTSNSLGDYYSMELNILYNGVAMNSPDPTIINTEIPGQMALAKERPASRAA